MNIERGPRKPRGFVIIDNALAQNNRLSFGARGLAEYLLSLPPGTKVDIRSLAADNPEGRAAIAGYMNELEAERYLVRSRTQGERGRFVTKTTIHEEPQDPASLPTSLPKPWSKAKRPARGHLSSVPADSEAQTFSQVGPNPASPDFGQPNFGEPGPGRPDAGETGVNPFKEPGERTSSSPVREELQEHCPEAPEGGGGGDEAPQQEQQDVVAAAFVDRLPYRGRIPGPRQRAHLIGRVSEALAAGWPEFALKAQLTDETDTAKSLAAVYRHRLEPEHLPAPPMLPKPRDVQEDAPQARKARCPECHRPLRNSSEDALCSDCREDVTA
ncbi:hypothetical protein [Streptomyces sp. NPDC007074]|uniref:hypothetical protein n=1 Tax=Streptomyces sp. NPDC007074 TaxID=3156764 RepID=UPI0033D784A3